MNRYISGKRQIYAICCLSFLFLFSNCKKKENQNAAANQVKEYAVITVQPTRTQLKTSYPASIRGIQDIEIRPNVSGFITELLVDEGATVKKGQPLFKIDPVSYQAAVISAEANVNVVETAVRTASLTLENKRNLRNKNIISDYELETAENDYASQLAQLNQAKAELLNARNNLSYTTVTSPSDGVIGTIPYRVGSLVSPSITEPMTTVSDISSMYVYFSMTEKQVLDFTRQRTSIQHLLDSLPPVQLQLADSTLYPHKGRIEIISGVIDQTTGSASMRARFPNRERILRSGGTGVVQIPHIFNNVIVIPQRSTYDIQDKKFVYMVTDSSTVKGTEITIYPVDNGKEYVVTKGLKAGDRIVSDGVGTLRDGTHIKPVTPEQAQQNLEHASQSGTPPQTKN